MSTQQVIDPETIKLVKEEFVSQVILFNCNCHTFDTVIEQLIKAIGCSSARASQFAYVADQFGSVKVFEGEREKCERVADIIGSAGLIVKVTQ
ncbi:MAG: ATP-dependent Clp protease adaptor ClpS [Patescibacteria group bacterium]